MPQRATPWAKATHLTSGYREPRCSLFLSLHLLVFWKFLATGVCPRISMCIFNLILMSLHAWWEMGKPSLSFKAKGRPAKIWLGHFRSKADAEGTSAMNSSCGLFHLRHDWECKQSVRKGLHDWSNGRLMLTVWCHWGEGHRFTAWHRTQVWLCRPDSILSLLAKLWWHILWLLYRCDKFSFTVEPHVSPVYV